MNIILQKRQYVLENNNTAQSQLENVLERMVQKNIDLLELNILFNGNLDFSVLSDYGFHNIKTISLGTPGEITSITNLPNTLEKLVAPNQYLIELSNLPRSLKELDIHDNYLTNIDVKDLKKLKSLNVSHNKIEKIENLPESLEEVYCNNNQISQLILKNALNLRILNCSNNKTIIIDGRPPSLVDFKCDNNPYILQHEILDIHGNESPKTRDMESTAKRIEFYEALREYFKMKNNYETEFKEDRKNAYKKAKIIGISKKTRARRVASILPKCIVCKRPVGSIFRSEGGSFIARCGDPKSPCSLNIELQRGYFNSTHNQLPYVHNMLADVKTEVITTKLNSIFKYKSEENALADFNEHMRDYHTFNQMYILGKEAYDKTILDPAREQLIERKTEQIYKLISAIKTLVRQYEKEGNSILLQTAIRMQKEELNPEIINLRQLKYPVMEMNENTLTQMYSNVENANFIFSGLDEPMVVKWSKET